jgi:hypothetical protein
MDESINIGLILESRSVANASHIEADLNWLSSLIDSRMKELLNTDRIGIAVGNNLSDLAPPAHSSLSSHYSSLIQEYDLIDEERLLLILALAPYIDPGLLDKLLQKDSSTDKINPLVGGMQSKQGRLFLPTIETFFFLAAGSDLQKRFMLMHLFEQEARLFKGRLLDFSETKEEVIYNTRLLVPTKECLTWCTTGTRYIPPFNNEFPAKEISTSLEWSDLILAPSTKSRLQELLNWLQFKNELYQSEYGKHLKPGYRVLFYGSPGTGKSLTASLLGKLTGVPVFRIDLSKIVSKFIGETEKNLARVFDKAEHANWILFFDEADALFGSRTQTSSSNDRYANQEVSYLLQRIEEYSGMVVLASNYFARRFNEMIHFPLPDLEERKTLWNSILPESVTLENELTVDLLAKTYKLSGAQINNVISKIAIRNIASNAAIIRHSDIRNAVAVELAKEGKTL